MNENEVKQYIDTEKALGRIRGNTKLFKTLLNTFLGSPHFEQMKKEIEAGDHEAAAKSAHAIKGVAANLSLVAVYDLSLSLEASLKAGSGVEESFATFQNAYAETLKAIDIVKNGLPA
ncbi:MAG: Hpt domain-containing protein [Synergistaceae bacterium]|jgi:HPt (histidine-containing phosphotransfer) domain-containing protein|nr:Hpt domain-containing protein [Synergistaceae bacterium]